MQPKINKLKKKKKSPKSAKIQCFTLNFKDKGMLGQTTRTEEKSC